MYLRNAGMATAARIPRIATTIISSIRVNPLRFFNMVSLVNIWRALTRTVVSASL
jgi:hypothetical protein